MSERQPVEFHRSQLRFIAEQDGAIEQEFKQKLTDLFRDRKTVTKAYLAAADYGTPATFTVALCLRAFPSPDRALVKSVGGVFASIFCSAEHLDVLFIDNEQEMRLRQVCYPFYEVSSAIKSKAKLEQRPARTLLGSFRRLLRRD